MKDFRENKGYFQKKIIKFALYLLRIVGDNPEKHETKEDIRDRRKSYLIELIESGYKIEKLTEYQYRINGILDIYPTNAKFHDIKTKKRGSFHGRNTATFVRKYFKEL